MIPARGLAFVQPIETDETVAGGRIVLTPSTRERWAASQYEVLAVGAPEACDARRCDAPHEIEADGTRVHPTDPRLCAGAWVLVDHRAVVDASDPIARRYAVLLRAVAGVFCADALGAPGL